MFRRMFLTALALVLVTAAQGQPPVVNKCKTCSKPFAECEYRGRHPQTNPTNNSGTSNTGSIYITSSPSGAAIKLDGKYIGETPLTVDKQSVGGHTVTFSKDEYESHTTSVSVTAGNSTNCHASLRKKQSQNTSTTTTAQRGVRMDGNTIVCTVDGAEYRYKMVHVSGGTFTMGCTGEQGNDCYDDEKPAHSVSVSGFYIGQTEVTQALWKAVMGSNPSHWKGNTLPVEQVSYNDCLDFINKLNSLTGQTFRLPTEAEWEYAARGGNSSQHYKYSGSDDSGTVAWYYDNSGYKTHPVAQKRANELGLYDMSGNVWEWCSDWYWYSDYSSSATSYLKGSSTSFYRVNRGGGWSGSAWFCRVSDRLYFTPSDGNYNLGLRLAMSVEANTTTTAQRAVRMDGNTIVCTVDGAEYRYKMVYVDGGTFTMGCTGEQGSDCWDNEEPAHNVSVSGFYIGQTEVTQALWKAVMGSNPSNWEGNTLPVEMVSYDDCLEFINKLNSLTGHTFRLPTEAEWEYAARGGNSSRGYKDSGSDDIGAVAWYDSNSGNKTHAVAQKRANELGLYDMSGNVWEWCSDWYGRDYYSSSATTNPKGPSTGSYRVNRGGGWGNLARRCRVSLRGGSTPSDRGSDLGLRLAR